MTMPDPSRSRPRPGTVRPSGLMWVLTRTTAETSSSTRAFCATTADALTSATTVVVASIARSATAEPRREALRMAAPALLGRAEPVALEVLEIGTGGKLPRVIRHNDPIHFRRLLWRRRIRATHMGGVDGSVGACGFGDPLNRAALLRCHVFFCGYDKGRFAVAAEVRARRPRSPEPFRHALMANAVGERGARKQRSDEGEDGAHDVCPHCGNAQLYPGCHDVFQPPSCRSIAGPLQLLDSGLFPDHLPFRDLAGNVRLELIGSRAAHQGTEIEELFGYALAPEQLLHRFVRLLHDHGRRAGRTGEPVPTRDVVTGHARFGEGRDVGEHGVALRRGDGDGLEFAHLNLTLNGLHQLEYEFHLPRPQAGHRGRGAAVGNVRDVEAGGLLHQLAGEMLGRTDAGAAEIEFSGIGAHRS